MNAIKERDQFKKHGLYGLKLAVIHHQTIPEKGNKITT
jgi:hypothetical protein